MNILAIETASRVGSLSVRQGEIERSWVGEKEISRSEDLLPNIEKILSDSQLAKSQLDLIAVAIGPGSFTGLRVGISLAQALAFSLGIKCLGISALETLALSASLQIGEEKDVTGLIALARNNWCRQKFTVSGTLVEAQTGISLYESDELFHAIKKNEREVFVVDRDTLQRFSIESVPNILSVRQNLATYTGLRARSNQSDGPKRVVPVYLL